MDIPGEIRTIWIPRLERLIQSIMAEYEKSWKEACDALELSVIASSEQAKIDATTQGGTEKELEEIERVAQIFLQIIAEIRARWS